MSIILASNSPRRRELLAQIGKPGMNDGRREGCASVGLGMLPTGENPVTTNIPTF